MPESTAKAFVPPLEPVLNMDNIQGLVVPGFTKPHQTLVGIRIPNGLEGKFKELLRRDLSPATAAEVLADRRAFRAKKLADKTRTYVRPATEGAVFLAIAFGHSGLLRLTPSSGYINSSAFQLGLSARSALLGDPLDAKAEGNPANWVVGAPGSELDVLFIIAGDHRDAVTEKAHAVEDLCRKADMQVIYVEEGDVRQGKERGHEHFGFDDGVSQPGIRGRASGQPADFITERFVDPKAEPQHSLFGYPGQYLVWPGELVFGYAKSTPDPLVPGPDADLTPDWIEDGSFLVFRRLRQDVGLFWRTMRALAEQLASMPGFGGMTDEKLASQLVGRWTSGAPFNRTPKHDDPALGKEPRANNYFYLDSDTPSLPIKDGFIDSFPMAKADPAGAACPWAAHIRKVNVRDSGSDMGSNDSTFNRRLLRVGIPFGKSLPDKYAQIDNDPERGNRGLLFLSIQSSIEDQFEFLMSRWVNDAARPKMPGGNDMLIGQNTPTVDGVRRCTIFGSELQQSQLQAGTQWVIPTGGGYFFVPSLYALRNVIAH